ncbi:hypothetical protein OROHE_025240 [Orobanche hederae]
MAIEGEKQEIEQQLERAVCSRIQHFKDQADSLTMVSVRRLLERDLGLEKFALDAHKNFIKQYMAEKMDGAGECKSASGNVNEDVYFSNEATIMPEQHETKIGPKQSSPGDEEIMEDSPIMGVLSPKSEIGTRGSSLSEASVKKAIWRRADHFQANSENITLAGVRRLLEEDLGLEKNTLNPFKKFIREEIDQVLNSPKEAKSVKDVKKKASDNLKAKKSKNLSSEEGYDASHSESDEMEVKVKSRKGAPSKRNIQKAEQPKKRKISEESDLDNSGRKQNKPAKRQKEENDSDEDGSPSEDAQSQFSLEKSAQRKEKSVSGYGKKVENLKSIIKACGMSVPPSIYKKAKQGPDEEREAIIVMELEGILSREGLSKNPTEKEIKDCKKRKDRARELEGIDMSNIISSSRRRSAFSPVTPGIHAKKDKVDAKDSKEKDNDDKDHKDDSKEEDKKNEKDEEDEEEKEKEKDDGDEEVPEEVEDDEDEEVAEEVEDDDEDEEEEKEEEEDEEFNEDDNEESD